MSSYNAVMKVLEELDTNQQKPIRDDAEVARMMRAAIPEGQEFDPNTFAEIYAFSLLEDSEYGKENWQTYYGTEVRKSLDGSFFEFISIHKITPEVVDYWEGRIDACSNPILKGRYAGLVWVFSQKIRGRKADFTKVGLVYIDCLFQIVQPGRYLFSKQVFQKLERALSLSLSFRNEELKKRAIDAIRGYVKAEDSEKLSIWRYNYDLLVKDNARELPSVVVNEIVNDLEDRLLRYTKPNENGFVQLNFAHIVVDRLLDYYSKLQMKDEIRRVLSCLAAAYETIISSSPTVQAIYLLERLYEYYDKNSIVDEAENVYKRLQVLSPKIVEEMSVFRSEQNISMDLIDEAVAECLEGDIRQVFERLAFGFIPLIDNESLNLGIGEMSRFITKSLYDYTGRRVAKVGPTISDAAGNEIAYFARAMSYNSIMLSFCIKAAKKQSIISIENIMEFLRGSSLISPDKFKLVEVGVAAYLKEDYITALHVLIPQIEAGCLKLLELNGGSIWKEGKYGGDNVKLFDHVLREQLFIDTMGQNEATYLRAIFTDQRGWNLRNMVCHGIYRAESFDSLKADRVFVALLLLAHIRFLQFEDLSVN